MVGAVSKVKIKLKRSTPRFGTVFVRFLKKLSFLREDNFFALLAFK